MNRELVIDMMDLPLSTSTVVEIIRDLCDVRTSKIAIKIENKKSYNNGTRFDVTEDLCDWLSEFFEEECPVKNGCQIYKDLDTDEYYLCLTDSNYYDNEGNHKGTDETHVYFKQFSWDNLQAK